MNGGQFSFLKEGKWRSENVPGRSGLDVTFCACARASLLCPALLCVAVVAVVAVPSLSLFIDRPLLGPYSAALPPAAVAPQPVVDPPDVGRFSASIRPSTSSAEGAAGGGEGSDGAEGDGGRASGSATSGLDKVEEFSAWTGINAAELGQVRSV